MVRLVCPACQSQVVMAAGEEHTHCRTCGCLVMSSGGVSGGSRVDGMTDDDLLVADLREAFGIGTRGFGPGPGSFGRRGGSASVPVTGSAPLSPGSHLGDFEILGELGRGGMGIVYRARQSSLDRLVALKILPGAAWRGASAVRRFRREAQAAARLNHANVVPVYAQGEYDDSYYYAMKLIEGTSLDTTLRTRPELLSAGHGSASGVWRSLGSDAPATRAEGARAGMSSDISNGMQGAPIRRTGDDFRHIAALVAGVADGLAHAHEHGVIHRDIKPNNLILGEEQRLYITDFGLAYLISEPHLTVIGEVMGTPSYLSPEQIRGDVRAIDHRTDVYSLGVTLYELITQQRPFQGETRDQILSAICHTDPRPPRQVDSRIPIDLETICLRAVEKDVSDRHATARELAKDLRRFAEGRPILSRRVGPVEKAVKWARRHKAVTAAVVAMTVALAVSAAWAYSAAASRHREGDRLLQSAYERLAYLNYKEPELVVDDIDRAAALGVDQSDLLLTRALASLGADDQPGAIADLESLLEEEPANVRAVYMLAWACWRQGERDRSREIFREAEDLGGPRSAEDWFFRGLAVHNDDYAAALQSYRNANKQRALDHQFFPQAVLHLARAHNQQMYKTRTIDTFAEAESSLRQLIENGNYGAYPHYLLSITYRLAGEIYESSSGVRSDHQADQYFDEALFWARRGQEVDPRDDRAVTAEAEYLEHMGLFHEAIAARTRAIELARARRLRCEGHHYRWRLHYWVGDFDEAMRDVEFHATCTPKSPYYAHVYPALIYAESGDMARALAEARALSEASPTDAQMVLRSAACLRLLGRAEEAMALLLDRADSVDFSGGLSPPQTEEWVRLLFAFCMDQEPFDSLMRFADEVQQPWKLEGEAYFHAGAMALAGGRRDQALTHFSRAYRSFDGAVNYTFHAKVVFGRLQADQDWPWWIALQNGGVVDRASGVQELSETVPSTGSGEKKHDSDP